QYRYRGINLGKSCFLRFRASARLVQLSLQSVLPGLLKRRFRGTAIQPELSLVEVSKHRVRPCRIEQNVLRKSTPELPEAAHNAEHRLRPVLGTISRQQSAGFFNYCHLFIGPETVCQTFLTNRWRQSA